MVIDDSSYFERIKNSNGKKQYRNRKAQVSLKPQTQAANYNPWVPLALAEPDDRYSKYSVKYLKILYLQRHTEAGAFDTLFEQFHKHLSDNGLIFKESENIDVSFVDALQRNNIC